MENLDRLKEKAGELREILKATVAELPEQTCILLSGGLDSSLIAGLVLQQNSKKKLQAFSTCYKAFGMFDESHYVQLLQNMHANLRIEYLHFLDIDLIAELRNLMAILGEPVTTGSFLLQYLMLKRIRERGFENVLYGQYADELFGGYSHFLVTRARENLRRRCLRQGLTNLRSYRHRLVGIQDNRHWRWKAWLNFWKYRSLDSALTDSLPNAHRLVRIATRTADTLGLQLIVPYQDDKVINFTLGLTADLMVDRGKTKIILREAAQGIVPNEIIDRPVKFSFFAPDNIWLLRNRDQILAIKDPAVQREFKKFLNDPERRFYRGLWEALCNWILLGNRL